MIVAFFLGLQMYILYPYDTSHTSDQRTISHTDAHFISLSDAKWSPDSTRFAYRSIIYDNPDEQSAGVAIHPIDNRLTGWGISHEYGMYTYEWSPDSRYIATIGDLGICIASEDGQVRISKDAPSATALHWSPDSRKVAFTTEQGARARIQIVNLDGTNYREPHSTESAITGMARERSGFIWSKDSSAIWYIEQSQLIRLSTASGAQPQIIDQDVDLLVGRDRSGMIIYVQQRENASVMRRSRADGSATTDLFSMTDPIVFATIAP